jgi:IS30 family transposase
MRISHETIYQWIKEDKLLGGNLHMFLRQANKKRRKSYGKTSKRGQIPGRVFIEDRPQVVDRRNRFGDWEGDTVQSAGKKANIVTYVERKSRFLLSHVIGSKTPKEVNRATRIVFKGVPEKFCKTMTLDNGTEFAGFKDIEEALNIDVYFARPSQPNDRATNENTNGLIRQFLPKKKNFEFLKQRQLDKINRILNNRPRKCLNYRTPYEVLMRAVALQN